MFIALHAFEMAVDRKLRCRGNDRKPRLLDIRCTEAAVPGVLRHYRSTWTTYRNIVTVRFLTMSKRSSLLPMGSFQVKMLALVYNILM